MLRRLLAAGQTQLQQQDAEAAMESYERAAALGREALRDPAVPASGAADPACGSLHDARLSGNAETVRDSRSGAMLGSKTNPNPGTESLRDATDPASGVADPARDSPGGLTPASEPNPNRNNQEVGGRAAALPVVVRALLAQAGILRAQGLAEAAVGAEDEALALDPFAMHGTFELRQARAACRPGQGPGTGLAGRVAGPGGLGKDRKGKRKGSRV